MGQKRRWLDFESDLTDESPQKARTNGTPPKMHSADSGPSLTANLALDGNTEGNDEGWQVVQSSKKRKKKNGQQGTSSPANGTSRQRLRFNEERAGAPVRIKDLQCLVLYTLSDGVSPNWVAIRDAKSIEQVVVLMVPGMDKAMLEDAAARISTSKARESSPQGPTTPRDSAKPIEATPKADDPQIPAERQPKQHSLTDYIIRIKAPGDPKTGRMHSPLQTMLISPEEKKPAHGNRSKPDILPPTMTPLINFIHTAEELVDAEYPVHPAIFTNLADAALERIRREETGQSRSGGWVDTPVTEAMPQPASKPSATPITEGLRAYALDCEMVLTTDDRYSLARISVLDWDGKVVLDELVLPDLPIKNYFTQFSGITEEKLKGVTTRLTDVQKRLSELFGPSAVLLGHSLESDFNALKMTHPFVIDTSMVYPHPRGLPLRSSLKFLSNKYLSREIQKGGVDGHDSVEDSRAVLDLIKLKCEKGPTFGTLDMNGESIFSRLDRSGRKTAIVEYGTPERGFGRFASVKVGCQDDDEIVEGVLKATSKESEGGHAAAFTWGRLRNMEAARGWTTNGKRSSNPAPEEPVDRPEHGNGEGNHEDQQADRVEETAQQTVDRLVKVYDALDPSTLVIVYPGPGDMREVLRLQDMQRQYKREFKVKKWDELSVKWTDDEEQALRKAFNEARAGWALVCLK